MQLHELQRAVKQAPDRRREQQPIGRLLKGREVGHASQFNRRTELRRVAQHGRQLTIVESQELFQHQAREQLQLRELLWTELVALLRERPDADSMRESRHPLRALRGATHNRAAHDITLAYDDIRRFSTSQYRYHFTIALLLSGASVSQSPSRVCSHRYSMGVNWRSCRISWLTFEC